jgi:hypothetical protein
MFRPGPSAGTLGAPRQCLIFRVMYVAKFEEAVYVLHCFKSQKGQAMTIDTDIRHLTKAGTNLFLELGFSAAEAKKLHAASRKQINDIRALKQQLMIELSD